MESKFTSQEKEAEYYNGLSKTGTSRPKRMIAVSREVREELERIFKVTMRTVFNALAYDSETSGIQRRIRKMAIMKGGVVMNELPELETFHDTASGWMRQYTSNGAIIELSKITGEGHVYHKGEERLSYEHITLTDIPRIQQEAAAL